jgi:hypothetical protein
MKSRRRASAYQAIRAKCIECSGDSRAEVRNCLVDDCPLWMWRMGIHPETARRKHPDLLANGRRNGNGRVRRKTAVALKRLRSSEFLDAAAFDDADAIELLSCDESLRS